MQITTNSSTPIFKPVELTITIGSLAELKMLWSVLNISSSALQEYGADIKFSKDEANETAGQKWLLWNHIDNILRECK